MGKERPNKTMESELGLEIIPTPEGIKLDFIVSDGKFSDLEDARTHYNSQIENETNEIKQLQAFMTVAAGFQVYGVYKGFTEDDSGIIWPMIGVALIMLYVRNKSINPLKMKREVSRKKLELVENYESLIPEDIDDIQSDEIYPIFPN